MSVDKSKYCLTRSFAEEEYSSKLPKSYKSFWGGLKENDDVAWLEFNKTTVGYFKVQAQQQNPAAVIKEWKNILDIQSIKNKKV